MSYQFVVMRTLSCIATTRRQIIDTDLKIKTLVLHECPLWRNDAIGRELTRDEIRIVVDDFVQSGHGEWEDGERRARCRILWRRPEQLASDVYEWAVANGYIGSVCTVYELHSGEKWDACLMQLIHSVLHCKFDRTGEDVNGMSFQGADEELLRRALGILEEQGKCAMFQGETSSEDGIKFF